MINKFLKNNWSLIIILFLGTIPFFWFRKGQLIAGGDNSIYLNPAQNFFNYFFSWADRMDAGVPSLEIPKIFPFSFFWFIGGKIGFSLLVLEKIWVVLSFLIPGLAMNFLIRSFFDSSKKQGVIAGLVGACFYMFNFMGIVDAIQPVLRPIIAFLPIMFYFWVKGLDQERVSFKYAVLVALTSLFFASSNLNFATVFSIFIILFGYLIYFIFTTKKVKKAIVFSSITFFLYLLVNLWWLPNFYFSALKTSSEVIEAVRSYDFIKSTPINESFRTMGFWAFLQEFNQKPLLPFALSYYRFPLLFITFLIPIFGFGSLVFKTKQKEKIFFSFLALLGIFLAKGATSPFGFIFQFLYDKIPGFSIFREPFAKFTLIHIFSFSLLLGFFSQDLVDFLINRKKELWAKIFPFLVIFIILLSAYPLLSGANIQDETWYQNSRNSLFVKVPKYWEEAGAWFDQENSFSKVLLFPKSYYGQTHDWETGISTGDPVALYFLKNPLIRTPSISVSPQNRLANITYQMLFLGKQAELFPYLDLFAIDYVLQQNSVTPNNQAGIFDPLIMQQILENQKSLELVKSFGRLAFLPEEQISGLDVYKVIGNTVSKQVFQPKFLVFVEGKVESLPDLLSFSEYNPNFGYVFSQDYPKTASQAREISSVNFINLKDKGRDQQENSEALFDFDINQEAEYQLLINEYLFDQEEGTEAFYVSINDKKFLVPQAISAGWRIINLGKLWGQNTLKTNLPTEKITKEYFTSPFWLVENQVKPPFLAKTDQLVSFEKVNPSSYRVLVNKGTEPYLLVLSETFNENWQVYFNHKKSDFSHFLINGYANGWLIMPDQLALDEKGNYQLEITYSPQKITNVGARISIVAMCLQSIYILYLGLKQVVKIKRK